MAGDGVRWAGLLETPNGYVATVQSHMSKQVILTVDTVLGLFPMMTGLHSFTAVVRQPASSVHQ